MFKTFKLFNSFVPFKTFKQFNRCAPFKSLKNELVPNVFKISVVPILRCALCATQDERKTLTASLAQC